MANTEDSFSFFHEPCERTRSVKTIRLLKRTVFYAPSNPSHSFFRVYLVPAFSLSLYIFLRYIFYRERKNEKEYRSVKTSCFLKRTSFKRICDESSLRRNEKELFSIYDIEQAPSSTGAFMCVKLLSYSLCCQQCVN